MTNGAGPGRDVAPGARGVGRLVLVAAYRMDCTISSRLPIPV